MWANGRVVLQWWNSMRHFIISFSLFAFSFNLDPQADSEEGGGLSGRSRPHRLKGHRRRTRHLKFILPSQSIPPKANYRRVAEARLASVELRPSLNGFITTIKQSDDSQFKGSIIFWQRCVIGWELIWIDVHVRAWWPPTEYFLAWRGEKKEDCKPMSSSLRVGSAFKSNGAEEASRKQKEKKIYICMSRFFNNPFRWRILHTDASNPKTVFQVGRFFFSF